MHERTPKVPPRKLEERQNANRKQGRPRTVSRGETCGGLSRWAYFLGQHGGKGNGVTWADQALPLSILNHVLADAVLDALARLQNFQLYRNFPRGTLPDPVEIDLRMQYMPNIS